MLAIEAARARGVDLLVFPELSLTDYESHPDTDRLAVTTGSPYLSELAEAAGGMILSVGFIEQNPGGKPFNSGALIAQGGVLHVHRKLNLPTYGALVEAHHYSAGTGLGLAQTKLGRTASLICADTWNPALTWLAALQGAEIMIVPIASSRGAVAATFDSGANWALNLRHTAMIYGLPIVMANHCGERGGLDFWGGSMILDAHGQILAQAGEAPELIVAEIDLADGIAARANLPTIRNSMPAFIHAELARMAIEAS